MNYMCWHCQEKFKIFNSVIEHCSKQHNREPLKIRRLSVNPVTGNLTYITKDYKLIPAEVAKDRYKLVAQDEEKVSLERTPDEKSDTGVEAGQEIFPNTKHLEEADAAMQVETDEEEDHAQDLQRLKTLTPAVAECMRQNGYLPLWVRFHELVTDNSFPMNNISFRLFLDVVRFMGSTNSSTMRYSNEVKQFWAAGLTLFHGRFLRFMGGPKSTSQVVDGTSQSGFYDPQESKINFAVPDRRHLKTSQVFENNGMIKPGILKETLQVIGESKRQVKICFDGKKINSSLTDLHGDIDLFGCEPSPTLEERTSRKEEEITQLEDMIERAEKFKQGTVNKETALQDLQAALRMISLQIQKLREMAAFKQEGVKKFKSLSGPDWRSSKYAFVISSLQSSLFETNELIKTCLNTTDRLCKLCAVVQEAGHLYASEPSIDLNKQQNYICLVAEDERDKKVVAENSELERHILKQRSDAWFEVRRSTKVTGSTAHKALGLDTLKKQVSHFDSVVHGKEPEQHSSETRKRFSHGIQNEINALATLVAKVLPAFCPDLKFVEEGCLVLKKDDFPLITVSPDGSGRTNPSSPAVLAFEFKCPFPDKRYAPQVHYKIPIYYIIQLLSEMATLQCSRLLFISYTHESATAFEVSFCQSLWMKVLDELNILYGCKNPKRPTRLRPTVKELKEDLRRFSEENVRFLCEVPSLRGIPCSHSTASSSSPTFENHIVAPADEADIVDTPHLQTLFKAQTCIKECYNLMRRRATELFVFMMSDLDRVSSSESPHSLPIAYGLSGPSITTDTAAKMLLTVLHAADDQDLEPIVFSSDGQWINLVTRDFEGNPLTQIQRQKQYWQEIRKLPKQRLVDFFRHLGLSSAGQSTSAAGIECLSLRARHLALLVEGKRKSQKGWFDDRTEDDRAETARALSLLPSNLEDKVDLDTYNEILSTVKTLMKEESVPTEDLAEDKDREEGVCTETTQPTPAVQLSSTDCKVVISALKGDATPKQLEKWTNKTEDDLVQILSSANSMTNQCTKQELKIILKTMKQLFVSQTKHISLSSPKYKMVTDLALLLGIQPQGQSCRLQKCKMLKELCVRQVKKLPKTVLSSVYAELMYPNIEQEWRASQRFAPSSVVNEQVTIEWYSYPMSRKRDSKDDIPLLGVVDSHHILTNMRSKCCSTGILSRGIHREAWLKVAKDVRNNNTGLTLAHVDDLIDKQSNAFAKLTFSEGVEKAMRENEDYKEADFCKLIRQWYEADDEPGLDSATRLEYRLRLRAWLLSGYKAHEFPPPSSYVKGIPIVTFESLLTNIERKIQVYGFVEGHSYNPRSLTTLDVENFFSILGDYVPCGGKLAIRPADVPAAIKTACEVALLQINPSKSFYMHTSAAPVYPVNVLETRLEGERVDPEYDATDTNDLYSSNLSLICMRDHTFDSQTRRRRAGKRKSALLSGPSKPSKGAKGVRQYHSRDESKVLPHVRLGIDTELDG